MILAYNVVNASDVLYVYIKGSKSDWAPMTHNRGQLAVTLD